MYEEDFGEDALISLNAAKKAMFSLCNVQNGAYAENPHIDAIIDALDNLDEAYEDAIAFPYCPNCGHRMSDKVKENKDV